MTKKPTFGSDTSQAFTLIELLVSIAIISVLIAISLPALRGARSSAQNVSCQASLRNIAMMQQLYIGDYQDQWPNVFSDSGGDQDWTVGSTTTIASSVMAQVRNWAGPLHVSERIDLRSEIEALSCPVARGLVHDNINANPQIAPMSSYGYSPAFFTSAQLWDPDHQDRLSNPDDYRAHVRGSQIRFPSSKVSMFEIADYHGTGGVIGSVDAPQDHKSNAGFADGHVKGVKPHEAQQPLMYEWNELYGPSTPDRLPFSCAPWGFSGRDY